MVTPEGVLYEKEAILDCLLAQKKDYARKLALYEAQLADEEAAARAAAARAEEARVEEFHRMNHGGGSGPPAGPGPMSVAAAAAAGDAAATAAGASNVTATAFQAEQARTMKAFWLPSKTPEAASKVVKPSSDALCPATGKKLRLKDLVPVRFTRVPGDEPADGGRFMCPTCKEVRSRARLRPRVGGCVDEPCSSADVHQRLARRGAEAHGRRAV